MQSLQHTFSVDSCFVSSRVLVALGIILGETIAISLCDGRGSDHDDIVLVSCQYELSGSDADDNEVVYVSPVALHRMGIVNSSHMKKTVHVFIYRPANILYQNGTAVTLSRVAGYRYPDDEAEKKILLRHFSEGQKVLVGDFICVCGLQELFQADDNLYLYFIRNVDTDPAGNDKNKIIGNSVNSIRKYDDSSEYGNDTNTSSNNSGYAKQSSISDFRLTTISRPRLIVTVTVKDKTTIVMKGRTNCTVPDIRALKDFFYIVRQNDPDRGPWNSIRNLLEVSVLKFCDAMSIVLQLACSVKSSDNYNICDSRAGDNMNNIGGEYSVSDATLFNLIKSPTLVESTTGEEGEYITFIPLL